MPINGSKFQNLGGQIMSKLFLHLKNWHLTVNGQLVTYSKIQSKTCGIPYTYELYLNQISQYQFPFKLMQMCQKKKKTFLNDP